MMIENRALTFLEQETSKDVLFEISLHLTLQDELKLALTSKPFLAFFGPRLAFAHLLQLVGKRDLEKAGELLKQNPKLLQEKGQIIDLSDRVFDEITIFQFSIWSLDSKLREIVREHLPKEHATRQFLELESGTPKFVKKHGKFFNLENYKNSLEKFFTEYANYNSTQAKQNWSRIGKLQGLLPANIAGHIFRKNFELTLKDDLTFYNYLKKLNISLFPADKNPDLGENYALIHGGGAKIGVAKMPSKFSLKIDLDFVTELWNIKQKEYEQLKTDLLTVNYKQINN